MEPTTVAEWKKAVADNMSALDIEVRERLEDIVEGRIEDDEISSEAAKALLAEGIVLVDDDKLEYAALMAAPEVFRPSNRLPLTDEGAAEYCRQEDAYFEAERKRREYIAWLSETKDVNFMENDLDFKAVKASDLVWNVIRDLVECCG